MPEFKIVNRLDESDWREFVDRHPQGNVFHTPEMFRVFERTKGLQPGLWAAITGRGQVVALFLPVRITLSNRLSQFTTRAVAYGGVLCGASVDGLMGLELLLNAYVRATNGGCLFTEMRNLSCLEDAQPILRKCGFSYEPHLNYLIDLNRPVSEIFERIGHRTRKNIRHGINRGDVRVREICGPSEIAPCYDLLCQTYQAARVPLCDISLFEAAWEVLAPKGMVRFTLAEVRESAAATSVELMYKDVVYGWYGGMDRRYRQFVPGELLMWHILQWGAQKGYRLYDFGGAGKPGAEYGVREFKSKFGGELVCYGRNLFVHSPKKLWLSRKAYEMARRLSGGRFLVGNSQHTSAARIRGATPRN